jgi:surfeit locus 1 family protein
VSLAPVKSRSGILEATIFAVVGVTILIGLGIWQLDRKVWKEVLIATVNERVAQAPQPLPPRESWPRLRPAGSEYAHVTFPAEFIEGQEALAYTAGSSLRPDVTGQGYWVFAPARLSGGSVILINRGFVPADKKDAATRSEGVPHGSVDISGYMRWPEARGLFTPADDVKGNVFFARDPKAMSDAHHWSVAAPFYIDQEAPVPPGGLPKPGKIDVQLPNNHFQYALTWFGLGLGLAGVYIVWLAGRLRRRS